MTAHFDFSIDVEKPDRQWIHTHRFHEVGGITTIKDEVAFRLPLWPAGEMLRL